VVIAIIGILLALLLPAVQAARAAARRTECRSHLKQLALAFLQHHEMHGFFPSGGWAHTSSNPAKGWGGLPGRGTGPKQPGGWGYTTLPFLEQQPLADLGLGLSGEAYLAAGMQLLRTPLQVHYCPSRRQARLYPNGRGVVLKPHSYYRTESRTLLVAKCDYAANLGDPPNTSGTGYHPPDLSHDDDPRLKQDLADHTGISYSHSRIRMAQVLDGTSNTYMIGEKYLNPAHYTDGLSGGDDGTVYASHNSDNHRSTHPKFGPPRQDQEGQQHLAIFGSAHAAGFHMAFCDGSVRTISYAIDPEIHRRFGNREDGLPTGGSGL